MSRWKCVHAHDRCFGGAAAGPECQYCERITKPKRVTSWRVCPECGSRATKIFYPSFPDKPLKCEACGHHYNHESWVIK